MPTNSKQIHQLADLGDIEDGDTLPASRNEQTGRVSVRTLLEKVAALEQRIEALEAA